MALVLANRVQEAATANTTVSFTLTGAVAGFQSFAAIGDTNTTYYSATDGAGNWEVGLGTYSTTGPTLTRTTVYASSNSGSAVTFSGAVNVFVTYPSGRSVNLDASGNVSALGTVASGTWQGSTIGVAYGGTGVTTSSGANSVVLRDANQNITVNRVSQANTSTTAAGGTTALTAASSYIHTLVGTGGQTYTMPDATTLTTGVAFVFNNMATGTLTIQNYAAGSVGTIPAGGAGAVFLTDNSTTGGIWDIHAYLPEGVTFGTNAFNLGTSVISGGTWQGGTIQPAYGGTGLTTFVGTNNALYSTGATTLTAGTLPVAAGGTGVTTLTGYVKGAGTSPLTASASIPNSDTTATSTNTANTIVARDASGDFSAGTITATLSGNATNVSGTVAIANGGTGQTTKLAAFDALSPLTTKGDLIAFDGTDNVRVAVGTNNFVLTADSAATTGIAWKAGPSATITIDNKTGAYTVVSTDLGKVINCTANTFTVSLTAAATLGAGFNCWIWNTSTTASNVITIDPAGSETIDGVSTLTLRRGEGVQIVCDGTNWQTNAGKELRSYAENFTATSTRPVASGSNAIAVGTSNTASGTASAVFGGSSNTASNTNAFVGGGIRNTASGLYAFALGLDNNADTDISAAILNGGRSRQNVKIVVGGLYSVAGDGQYGLMQIKGITTNATPLLMNAFEEPFSNTTNIENLQLSQVMAFSAVFVAKTQGSGTNNVKAWRIEGLCKRASSGTASFVGTPITTILAQDSGASAWTLEATIVPGTNGANGFTFTATGAAATNIRWQGAIQTTELIY